MNERIREFAQQAFFETEYDDVQNLPETMERFAELIIKECAIIADKWVDDTDNGQNYPSEMIQQHFGVE
jgi:hypothetical protein